MFSTAGWGSRKLSIVPPEDSGYSGRVLKAIGRYRSPQFKKNLTQIPYHSMMKHSGACQKTFVRCGVAVPLPLLTEHIKSCDVIDVDDNLTNVDSGEPEERKCKNSLFKILLAYYIAFIKLIQKPFLLKYCS